MEPERKTRLGRVITVLMETFGLSHASAIASAGLIGAVICFGLYWFLHAAPPRVMVITSGTPGSSFETNAIKYRQILARSGVTLKILPSRGSQENLERLQ